MKSLLRLSLGTLMLVGTIAATAYPTTKAWLAPGDGTDPAPLCYPTDPKCKPPGPILPTATVR